MGNLRACLTAALLATAGCESEQATKVDAAVVIADAPPPDAKEWFDAPPTTYDLSCFGAAPPTTAADPVTIAGTTQTVTQSGPQAVPNVAISVYRTTFTTPAATAVSDSTGKFTTTPIVTGAKPFDGHIRATDTAATPTYRTTYLYPPDPVVANLTDVPVALVSTQGFAFLDGVAGASQNDAENGALVFSVIDCNTTDPQPITDATIKVQQNDADVGTIFDLGTLTPQAAGTYFVFNVPDGATNILVSYNNMSFPTRTVVAHKKPAGPTSMGTVTATAVRPGP